MGSPHINQQACIPTIYWHGAQGILGQRCIGYGITQRERPVLLRVLLDDAQKLLSMQTKKSEYMRTEKPSHNETLS
jgi:hypothetical protein